MKKLLCVVSAVVLFGCASHGHNFSIDQANQIKNGMTREEVIDLMGGKPNSVSNQGKTFIWSYAKVGFMGGTESRSFGVNFNDQGQAYGVPDGGVYGDTKKYQY